MARTVKVDLPDGWYGFCKLRNLYAAVIDGEAIVATWRMPDSILPADLKIIREWADKLPENYKEEKYIENCGARFAIYCPEYMAGECSHGPIEKLVAPIDSEPEIELWPDDFIVGD